MEDGRRVGMEEAWKLIKLVVAINVRDSLLSPDLRVFLLNTGANIPY